MRHNKRVDGNHTELLATLNKAGDFLDTSKAGYGLGDAFGTLFGVCMWVEFKLPKGRLTEAEKRFQSDCERIGVRYEILRSVEDCEALIERVRQEVNEAGEGFEEVVWMN
jgi:hypothetical protein